MSAGLAQCGATATTAAAPWLEQQRAQVAWQLVFDSGYLTQADAYYCMQASRMLGVCARAARNLWQCIDLSCDQAEDMFDNWSEAMLNSITAKRPKELILNMCATREHVSAILGRSAQLRRLTFNSARMECMRALDSLQVPLVALALECEDDQLDEEFLAELVAAAPQLTQLTELRLGCNTVGDACAHLIATQFAQLRTLSFADCGVTEAAVHYLSGDNARTRTTLCKLNLNSCSDIQGDIANDILPMPNLTELSVRYVELCTADWAADLQHVYEQTHGRQIKIVTAAYSMHEADDDSFFQKLADWGYDACGRWEGDPEYGDSF